MDNKFEIKIMGSSDDKEKLITDLYLLIHELKHVEESDDGDDEQFETHTLIMDVTFNN